MIDELELRTRFPEIPWDQPVEITIEDPNGFPFRFLACRYCIAMHGLKAQDVLHGRAPERVFPTRVEALEHVEQVHHE